MRFHFAAAAAAAACAAFLMPCSAIAQSTDLGRSLANLVGTVVTTNKQRKIAAQLSVPLTYEAAAGPRDPSNPADPRNLDIGGVRIGMTIKEAQSALRAAGYVDGGPLNNDQLSYMGKVTWAWHTNYDWQGDTNDRVPSELRWNKGAEDILVSLVALPEGPRVHSVFYQAKEEASITKDDFTRRVLAKYGEPVNDDPNDFRWCTIKAPECERPPENEYPLLIAWPSSRQIRLFGNDPGMNAALDKRFTADVESRKPAGIAPSF